MSRLRPVSASDHYGYVSRVDGDQRLINHKNQEEFFAAILAENELPTILFEAHKDPGACLRSSCSEPRSVKLESDCLASLRKLREGIIAAQRLDAFAIDVLERTLRFAIVVDHAETYLPCMRHLLKEMYPRVTLSASHGKVREEVAELYLLHLCSMSQYDDYYHEKVELRCSYGLADDVIQTIVQGNWSKWHRIRENAGTLQRSLIDKTHERLASRAFACIAASYMKVETSWVTRVCGGETWLADEDRAQWTIDGPWLVLRKPKKGPK